MMESKKFKLHKFKESVDFTQIELTPKEAIMAKCWDCCCYERREVKACTIKGCPLITFKNKWFNVSNK